MQSTSLRKVCLIGFCLACLPTKTLLWATDTLNKRLPTITDSIEMVSFRFPGFEQEKPAISPDGKKVAVVLYKGNIQENSNEASILLFEIGALPQTSAPTRLLQWASSSNLPAISHLRWLADNQTILFLGERPGQTQQVFSLDSKTNDVDQLTRHPTPVLDFAATPDLLTLVYIAQSPARILDDQQRAHGFEITDQWLGTLQGSPTGEHWELASTECFVSRSRQSPLQIHFPANELPIPQGISLSPSGQSLVLAVELLHSSPESWKQYETRWGSGQNNVFFAYKLIDIHTLSSRLLINAPSFCIGCMAWSSNEKSILLGGTYLPLDITDAIERNQRKSTEWAVEVNLDNGQITKIVRGNHHIVNWQPEHQRILLERASAPSFHSSAPERSSRSGFEKKNGEWQRVPATEAKGISDLTEIMIEEGMNTPPRLFLVSHETQNKTLLYDPNPQFQDLRFGRVQEVTWEDREGRKTTGGLYLPPDYTPGRRYPLVIQTHGWNPHEFWIDGYSTAGYCAQALAGEGFVVAQIPMAEALGNINEGPQNMVMIEGLIDALHGRGIIDRKRIGIQAFSRTGYAVRYLLAFSKYHFAAAVLADAMEAGYYEYVATMNLRGGLNQEAYERQSGAKPFGPGLKVWLSRNPSFNLEKVHTPVLEFMHGPYHLGTWEWYAGLKRLGKPVKLILLPDAAHEPVRPAERLTEQQATLDWFQSWLKDVVNWSLSTALPTYRARPF